MNRIRGGHAFALALLLAPWTPADAALTTTVSAGALQVQSDGGDAIGISCDGMANVAINGQPPDSGAFACASLVAIEVVGGPDANQIDLTPVGPGNFPALASVILRGGGGDDNLIGSLRADTLHGDDGNDRLTGLQGDDTLLGGAMDDFFAWNPGHGNDVIEGDDGVDRLQFTATSVAETLTLAADATRVRLQRDAAGVTLDLNALERIELATLGGADDVAVGSLAGTGVLEVVVDLGVAPDAQIDVVRARGSDQADTIDASASVGGVQVTSGAATLRVLNPEPGVDRLSLEGAGADDVLSVSPSLIGVISVDLEGGDGIDGARLSGTALDDVVAIAPSAPAVSFTAIALIGEVAAVETLRLDLLDGDDTVSTADGPAPSFVLQLDGGDGDDVMSGSDGADLLIGGAGDDRFQWNAGDGSDTLDAGADADRLVGIGAPGADTFGLASEGASLRLRHVAGDAELTLDGFEAVELVPLAGADTIQLDLVPGGTLARLELRLAAAIGGAVGDGQGDQITYAGTTAADSVTLATATGAVTLAHEALQVSVFDADPVQDRLQLELAEGDDTLMLATDAARAIGVGYDGGPGSAVPDGDRLVFGADPVAETYSLSSNAGGITLARTVPSAFQLAIAQTERIELALRDGADTISTALHPGLRQVLDGGAPTSAPGDALNVIGFNGDVTVSPIVGNALASIEHAGFEQSNNQLLIDAILNGAQQVPPHPSTATGRGRVTFNAAQTHITVFLEYAGLLGNSTLVHLHGPARRREAAPAVLTLPVSGNTIGILTAGPFALTPVQVTQVKAGLWYFDVHSNAANAAGGEIRGQVDGRVFVDGFE
jgi:Ca2+-binding RTX toxin-like protein